MATKIQIRRGTAASWTSTNPTLSSGELGLETDTNKVKIGDGATAWNSLAYFYDQSALSQASASATYLTQAAYASASPNFATDAELASAIVTASAAAVAYADALTTADVAENTNLYFTNERAINAGSATYILQSSQQGIINSASAAAVTAVLDGAPGALDTLNELAQALNDDASFATTVTNSLAAKLDASSASTTYLTQSNASSTYAPLSSPALTGTPTAPTATVDTNTTQVATTQYVVGQGYLKSSSASTTYLTQSSASTTYLTQSSASITYAPIASPTFTGTVTVPTLDLTNALAIVDGGTGATSASAAINALVPSQTSNNGKYLTTNGSAVSWGTVDALPSQTGNEGKYLTTNGSTASWSTVSAGSSSDSDQAVLAMRIFG